MSKVPLKAVGRAGAALAPRRRTDSGGRHQVARVEESDQAANNSAAAGDFAYRFCRRDDRFPGELAVAESLRFQCLIWRAPRQLA